MPVTTGITGTTDIEVTGGLQEGDEIVTGVFKVLRILKSGTKVTRDNTPPKLTDTSTGRKLSRERMMALENMGRTQQSCDEVIVTENLWKTYIMGEQELHALRGGQSAHLPQRVCRHHGPLRLR